jgi:hypothetical protein
MDNMLWEDYWAGQLSVNGGWSGPYDRGMGPLGSDPSVAITPAGYAYVFWRGTDSNLMQALDGARGPLSGPWPIIKAPYAYNVAGAPSVGVDANGATYIYWTGYEGNLWEDYWTGQVSTNGGWRGPGQARVDSLSVGNLRVTASTSSTLTFSFDYSGTSATGFTAGCSCFSQTGQPIVYMMPATARSVTESGLAASTQYCVTIPPNEIWGFQTSLPVRACGTTQPQGGSGGGGGGGGSQPANAYLSTQQTFPGGGPEPTCPQRNIQYTLTDPSGHQSAWNDTLTLGESGDQTHGWTCVWSDPSGASRQLSTGTWNITVTSGTWSATCTPTLHSGADNITFTYGDPGCSAA